MSNTSSHRSFGGRILGCVIALIFAAVALTGCGGGGGGGDAAPAAVPEKTALSVASISLATVTAGSGVTPPNPVARDATLSNSFTVTGTPGAVTAIVSSSACDGAPFAFTATVTEVGTGGTVGLAHSGALLPPGGECSYTLKVSGSAANPDGSLPSDTKTYSFVADSATADRVIVLSSTQNHAPVVYVRQDDGAFVRHLPKKDFEWVPGNCLVQRVATSMQIRAVACQKIGVVDAGFYVLALSAADWTLSANSVQVAKLGTVPAVTDLTYWMSANELVNDPAAVHATSVPSKTGTFVANADMSGVGFIPANGSEVVVATSLGSTRMITGW